MRIAINGFGRIGKNFLQTILRDANASKKITVVAINIGPAHKEFVAHLFKYDSLLGIYPGNVSFSNDQLHIDTISIPILTETNAELLPWKKLGIDWVVDCSGKYTKHEKAMQHCTAGARAVLISAPSKDADVMIIPGVNMNSFQAGKHKIVSLGSCTTNALVPMLKVMHDAYGIEHAFMTTVHAYTNSQVLLDVSAGDPRRSRAAAINCIPTTTGASESVSKVLPELADKVFGVSLRIPLDKVSLVDLAVNLKKEVTKESINAEFKRCAQTANLKGIITCSNEPLVSSDFKGNSSSVIFDETLTQAQGTMAKVFGWYDNEWGYSERLKDFLLLCE